MKGTSRLAWAHGHDNCRGAKEETQGALPFLLSACDPPADTPLANTGYMLEPNILSEAGHLPAVRGHLQSYLAKGVATEWGEEFRSSLQSTTERTLFECAWGLTDDDGRMMTQGGQWR